MSLFSKQVIIRASLILGGFAVGVAIEFGRKAATPPPAGEPVDRPSVDKAPGGVSNETPSNVVQMSFLPDDPKPRTFTKVPHIATRMIEDAQKKQERHFIDGETLAINHTTKTVLGAVLTFTMRDSGRGRASYDDLRKEANLKTTRTVIRHMKLLRVMGIIRMHESVKYAPGKNTKTSWELLDVVRDAFMDSQYGDTRLSVRSHESQSHTTTRFKNQIQKPEIFKNKQQTQDSSSDSDVVVDKDLSGKGEFSGFEGQDANAPGERIRTAEDDSQGDAGDPFLIFRQQYGDDVVDRVFQHAQSTKQNPVGWTIAAFRDGYWRSAAVPDSAFDNGQRFVTGKYADCVNH